MKGIGMSRGRRVFLSVNVGMLFTIALLCVLPLVHVFAVSLSDKASAAGGLVTLWPINYTSKAYAYVLGKPSFWTSMGVTIRRVVVGSAINMTLTVMCAYPLSKGREKFRARGIFAWFFFFSSLFSGGLIPGYILVSSLKLMDTIWALVLPGAVPIFNVILMLNFFRQIPTELEEAAAIDGTGIWKTLFLVYIPCSLPSIATVALFSIVHHWNSYFDGMIFSNFPSSYPLQTYLRTVLVSTSVTTTMSGDDWKMLQEISDRTIKSSQIFIAALPILAVYPFLQKYFVKGITIGSVKG